MLNICVKFVNNNCINKCKTSVYQSTVLLKNLIINIFGWVKHLFTNQLITLFSNTISTYQKSFFYLLNKTFTHYPHHLLLRPLLKN